MKRRYEDEGPAESEEKVARNIGIKGEIFCQPHAQAADEKYSGAYKAANAGTVTVENGTNHQRRDVRGHGGYVEREVEPDVYQSAEIECS